MGGYGSGPYGHMGSKTAKVATNQCLGLDVRVLRRKDLLQPGANFSWQWTRTIREERKKSTIGIKVLSDDEIQLHYTCTIDGVSKPIKTNVLLDSSPCNYGNHRVWFRCPGCHKRVALLYQRGLYFRCRHCHDLTYYSCQESGNLNDMSIRRVNRVLNRLKSDEKCGFDILCYRPRRPRYMHYTTYERLVERYTHKQHEYAVSVRMKLESFSSSARRFVELP